jgi:hypothetical protein
MSCDMFDKILSVDVPFHKQSLSHVTEMLSYMYKIFNTVQPRLFAVPGLKIYFE